jgi:hypothetical protein
VPFDEKIFGWTPIPYTKEEIESEELQMPANLKTAILKLPTDVVYIMSNEKDIGKLFFSTKIIRLIYNRLKRTSGSRVWKWRISTSLWNTIRTSGSRLTTFRTPTKKVTCRHS